MMDNPEGPAKNYQIRELTTQVIALVSSVSSLNDKIDSRLVTKEQLQAANVIQEIHTKAANDKAEAAMRKITSFNKKISKIGWIVIGVIVPIIVLSLLQLIANGIPTVIK